MLVPAAPHATKSGELAEGGAEASTVGDPLDARNALGPLVSAAQRERVRDYIQQGIEEGADARHRRRRARPRARRAATSSQPTVFADVTPDMTIAQEEIFGPVLVDHPLRRRGRRGRASPTTRSTASPAACGRPTRSAPSASRGASAPARSTSTAAVQPARAVRRLQAVRQRPRVRQVRPRGVPRIQGRANAA